jgi:ketosteroid isomerase-like protein
MSQNVEALRRAAEAVKKNDPSILDELLDPEVVWEVRETAPDLMGTYHGIDEVRGWFAKWEQAWEAWDWNHPEMTAHENKVIARMHLWGRGRNSGIEIEDDIWQVWSFRNGKVIHYRDFANREEALAAAGLHE